MYTTLHVSIIRHLFLTILQCFPGVVINYFRAVAIVALFPGCCHCCIYFRVVAIVALFPGCCHCCRVYETYTFRIYSVCRRIIRYIPIIELFKVISTSEMIILCQYIDTNTLQQAGHRLGNNLINTWCS